MLYFMKAIYLHRNKFPRLTPISIFFFFQMDLKCCFCYFLNWINLDLTIYLFRYVWVFSRFLLRFHFTQQYFQVNSIVIMLMFQDCSTFLNFIELFHSLWLDCYDFHRWTLLNPWNIRCVQFYENFFGYFIIKLRFITL